MKIPFKKKIIDLFGGIKQTTVGTKKIIAVTAMVIANLAAAGAGTYAWFLAQGKDTKINTVSGDLNVNIKKVTAYKYVYPFYQNTVDFINYDGEGTVKARVIEDASIADDPSFTSQTVVTLGSTSAGNYITSGNGTSSQVSHASENSFVYYLVGNSLFTGTSSEWTTADSIAFFSSASIAETPATTIDVVLSVGAEFILFDTRGSSPASEGVGTCNYFSSYSINGAHNRFEITENNTIRCLKSGVYSFAYSNGSLTINAENRTDEAIVGNNILDPTLISLDYNGSVNKTTYPTIEDYVSTGVYEQNTMVILDVELTYKNASEIVAGLKVIRSSSSAFDYNDNRNLTGYISESQRNALNASDFYAFYPILTNVPYENASEIWTAMHQKTDVESEGVSLFSKFDGEATNHIDCTLHVSGDLSNLVIDPSEESETYHCYIGVEYDYEHTAYFLNGERLANTYMLDRDFGFYFTGSQLAEEAGQ